MEAYKDEELVVGEIYAPNADSPARFKFVSSDVNTCTLYFTAGGNTAHYMSNDEGLFQFSFDDTLRWYKD